MGFPILPHRDLGDDTFDIARAVVENAVPVAGIRVLVDDARVRVGEGRGPGLRTIGSVIEPLTR